MLRRYVIVNGTSTAILYGGIYALLPSTSDIHHAMQAMFNALVMQSPILGPLVNKVVVVISCL